jgi:glycosyltransferase involved in cell wall biosynthesis
MYEILKIPDIILVPSFFVKDLFLKYYPFIRPRIKILPLGIPPIVRPRKPKERGKKMRFCYFGNILPFKGLHLLIDAFKSLPQGRAILTIYGSGTPWTESYDHQLKEQARGYSIDFRGPFKRENLSEALNDQDVVVLPSLCPESFSLVIREANSLGLPVIASRIGAIPEAVEEGVNGLLFEPGDVEGLTRCMSRFIDEPNLIEKMASKMPKVKWMPEHAMELIKIYQEIKGKG